MNLSPHFTLEEMTFSDMAIRKDIDNSPSAEITNNLRRLCMLVLEPIRTALNKPIHITSGYRCEALNKTIGGAKNSQHCQGMAADIHVDGMATQELYDFIKGMNTFSWGQLIQEFDSWVHISYGFDNENLIATKVGGKTVYTPDIARFSPKIT